MAFYKVNILTINFIKLASLADQLKYFYKLQLKHKLTSQNIWFNQECIRNKLSPKYITRNMNIKLNSTAASKALIKAKQIWIKEEVKTLFRRRDAIRTYLKVVHSEITFKLHPIEFDILEDNIKQKISEIIYNKYQVQKQKIQKLKQEVQNHCHSGTENVQFKPRFENLSDVTFNEKERKILSKGPKFIPEMKINNKCKEILGVATEIIITKNKDKISNQNFLKYKLADHISNNQNSKSCVSYTLEEIKSIGRKINSNGLVVTKADKSNTTVIMRRDDYEEKISNILNDLNLTILFRDPTIKFIKDVKDVVHNLDTLSNKEQYSIIPMNGEAPKLYGLLKLHKENHSLRPVVSYCKAPCGKLSKFLSSRFREVVKFNPEHSISSSLDLINKLNKFKSNGKHFKLVSFDVCSMFPSIPPTECLTIISDLLDRKQIDIITQTDIISMFKLCLEQNYFQYNNTFYRQNSGLPMGSPLSPLLADIFMDHLESKILSSNLSNNHILFWFRYVDDIIVGFNGTNRQIDLFLKSINSMHPNIKFTVEIENENHILNYLDLSIKHLNDKFDFNIYRKDSFSDSVISFDSFSPNSHKYSAFRSMVHRAFSVPLTQDNLHKELDTIRKIADNNGFPISYINSIIKKRELMYIRSQIFPNIVDDKLKVFYSIPYFGQISYYIKKKLEKFGINIAFKPCRNVGNIMFNVKDKTDNSEKCGVYRIDCSDCNGSYIGQTGRTFSIRYKEHTTRNLNSNFSKHLIDNNHSLSLNHQLQILHVEEKGMRLNLLEALEINKLNKNANINILNDQMDLNNSPLLNLIV